MRLVTHPVTSQVLLFALALVVFKEMVHVRSVAHNLLSTPLGNVPNFVLGALKHGEVLTLIALGVMLFTLFSVPLRLWTPKLQLFKAA